MLDTCEDRGDRTQGQSLIPWFLEVPRTAETGRYDLEVLNLLLDGHNDA